MKDIGKLFVSLAILGSSLAQEKDFTTKICDQSKGKEYFAKIKSCSDVAEQDYFAAISDSISNNFWDSMSDISDASCTLLAQRVLFF